MCPEKKFAVVILCNKTGVELQPVADRAAEMILGTEVNAVNESASREKPMPLDVLPEEASRYVGRYTNGAVTHLLKAEQGRLYFTRNRPVKKLGERSFIAQATVEAPAVSFSLVFNDRNEITHLMTKGRAFRKEVRQLAFRRIRQLLRKATFRWCRLIGRSQARSISKVVPKTCCKLSRLRRPSSCFRS